MNIRLRLLTPHLDDYGGFSWVDIEYTPIIDGVLEFHSFKTQEMGEIPKEAIFKLNDPKDITEAILEKLSPPIKPLARKKPKPCPEDSPFYVPPDLDLGLLPGLVQSTDELEDLP